MKERIKRAGAQARQWWQRNGRGFVAGIVTAHLLSHADTDPATAQAIGAAVAGAMMGN